MHAGAGLKLRCVGCGSPAIPGADVLADIASKDMVAHFRAMRLWDWAFEFNREVRDAEPGIELPSALSGHEGRGGAGVDAARAGSATVGWRFGGGCGEIQRQENFAQQKPASAGLIDEAGILSNPAEAREPGVGAFEQRRGRL